MGWLDALLGRTRLPKAKTEALFALATARYGLESDLGWKPAGRAGLCLKPIASGDFARTKEELRELLRMASEETNSALEVERDRFGYTWILLADPDLEDLVSLIHMAGQTLTEQGYGTQLLSAVFRFTREGNEALYLIYNYKRGTFYPFVPRGGAGGGAAAGRDNPEELRVSAAMSRELSMEADHTRWYPLWDCPV